MFKKKKKINLKKVSKVLNDAAGYTAMVMNTLIIIDGCHTLYRTFRRVTKPATAEAKVAEPAAEAAAPAQA